MFIIKPSAVSKTNVVLFKNIWKSPFYFKSLNQEVAICFFFAKTYLQTIYTTSQYLSDKTSSTENQTNSETGSSSSAAENENVTSSNNCVSMEEKKFKDEVII